MFCDQLGDFLEGLLQRAVDVLELFFQLDVQGQQVHLRAAMHPCTGVAGMAGCAVRCAELQLRFGLGGHGRPAGWPALLFRRAVA